MSSLAKPKRSHILLSKEQKKQIAYYAKMNPSSTHQDISLHFSVIFGKHIPRRTISDIVKSRDKLIEDSSSSKTKDSKKLSYHFFMTKFEIECVFI